MFHIPYVVHYVGRISALRYDITLLHAYDFEQCIVCKCVHSYLPTLAFYFLMYVSASAAQLLDMIFSSSDSPT
jgi:hypothetical protein